MDSAPTMKLVDQAEQKFGALNPAETKLFILAQEKFQELSDSEYALFRAIANGEPIDYRTHDDAEDNPKNAANWGSERTLRGDRLRFLCIEPEVWKLCLPQGLDISGAKIEGSFNLSFSHAEIPLRFFQCYFAETIRLQQTKLKQLDLGGTYIDVNEIVHFSGEVPTSTSISAKHLNVTGSVFLDNGFQSKGMVSLGGATIGGNLDCIKGKFTNSNGDALNAESINVMGSVFLHNGFQSNGRVSLPGANIRGKLDCSRGTFTNDNGDALNAHCISVTGNVFLSNGFQSKGRVSLAMATIGGVLDCDSGIFTNEDGDALLGENVNVVGGIFLRNGFHARGRVSLLGATVGGAFTCSGGTFTNDKGDALFAQRINVTGGIFLRNGFQAKGRVSLTGATIERKLDCSGGTFTNDGRDALVAENIDIKGPVLLRDGFQAKGRVTFIGATIGGAFDCVKGTFINEKGDALVGASINVKGAVCLKDGFVAIGKVSLTGAIIGGNLDCTQGTFINNYGKALHSASSDVRGSVFLSNDFQAKGTVSFWNARIGNLLLIARIKNLQSNCVPIIWLLLQQNCLAGILFLRKPQKKHEGMILDLQFAKVQTIDHREDSFPSPNNLWLNGLVYEALGKSFSGNGAQHLRWLRLQPQSPFSSQPYEQLAKILQATGKGDEAVQVLIAREQDELRYGELGWVSKIWEGFLGITIAYGYRPQRALLWALLVVLSGAFLFADGYNKGLLTPTEKDCQSLPPNTPQTCPNNPNHPKFNPYIYSLDVFLPIIDLRLKGAWLPNANKTSPGDGPFQLKSGAQLRYYFWFQIISGWVLTTLWVSGFTGLVRSTNK